MYNTQHKRTTNAGISDKAILEMQNIFGNLALEQKDTGWVGPVTSMVSVTSRVG